MEKKRRDRINSCLDELSSLLAEGEAEKTARLEKADILELTVKYWQGVRGEHGEDMEALPVAPEESSYLTGYKQCIHVVDDLLRTCQETGTEGLRQGLLQHLSSCVQELTPPPTASDNAGSDVQESKTTTAPTSGAETGNRDPSASPQCLTLVPARLPDGALALLLQEGPESKQSLKNEAQNTTSSSEPDTPSTLSSSEPQRKYMRSQQFIKVKDTEELLSPLPSTGTPPQAANPADPTLSPPHDTIAPAPPTKTEDKKEVSVCGGVAWLPGGEKTPNATKGGSEEYLMIIEGEEEGIEMEEEEEGETAMDLCVGRVWRPW